MLIVKIIVKIIWVTAVVCRVFVIEAIISILKEGEEAITYSRVFTFIVRF